jgi:hydrogenase-4 component F
MDMTDLQLDLDLLRAIVLVVVFSPLVTGVTGLAVGRLTGWWQRETYSLWFGRATFLVSIVVLAMSMLIVVAWPSSVNKAALVLPILGEGVFADGLSVYFILLVNVVACFASWNSIGYLKERQFQSFDQSPTLFHGLVNLFHCTMIVVSVSNNLVLLWIAIEATTLVSTLLVSFPNKKDSWEAAWKYLLITSTGIIFALLGTIFLAYAGASGAGDPARVMDWTFLLQNASELSPEFVKLSFLFIVVGYGTKAGFAPMHTWLPDGHGEAPPSISALLSGVLLKSALYAILRFYTITNAAIAAHPSTAQQTTDPRFFTSSVLLGAGLLSLVLAVPFILRESRFKRILAYHSLEHMGIITFGLGIGGQVAMFGALLHVFNHAITKALMFLSYGNILRRHENAARANGLPFDESRLAGLLQVMPVTALILAVGGLALVGMPPFSIATSEFTILLGALDGLVVRPDSSLTAGFTPQVTIAAVALFTVSTVLIFGGLVWHLRRLLLGAPQTPGRLKESRSSLAPLGLLLAIAVVFGVWIWPPLREVIAISVDVVLSQGAVLR